MPDTPDRVEAAARAHWQDGQGWDELPEPTKNVARSFMRAALAAADRAALAGVEGLAKRLAERKAFWLNGAHWMLSPKPDEDCQQAALALVTLQRRVDTLEAGLRGWLDAFDNCDFGSAELRKARERALLEDKP